MQKKSLGAGMIVFLTIVFVYNVVSVLVGVFGEILNGGSGINMGGIFFALTLVSVASEVALIVGLAMLLFAKKKRGVYVYCGAATVGFVVKLIDCWMAISILATTYDYDGGIDEVMQALATNMGLAIINLLVFPLITYLILREKRE